jgi:hypothetical protein
MVEICVSRMITHTIRQFVFGTLPLQVSLILRHLSWTFRNPKGCYCTIGSQVTAVVRTGIEPANLLPIFGFLTLMFRVGQTTLEYVYHSAT